MTPVPVPVGASASVPGRIVDLTRTGGRPAPGPFGADEDSESFAIAGQRAADSAEGQGYPAALNGHAPAALAEPAPPELIADPHLGDPDLRDPAPGERAGDAVAEPAVDAVAGAEVVADDGAQPEDEPAAFSSDPFPPSSFHRSFEPPPAFDPEPPPSFDALVAPEVTPGTGFPQPSPVQLEEAEAGYPAFNGASTSYGYVPDSYVPADEVQADDVQDDEPDQHEPVDADVPAEVSAETSAEPEVRDPRDPSAADSSDLLVDAEPVGPSPADLPNFDPPSLSLPLPSLARYQPSAPPRFQPPVPESPSRGLGAPAGWPPLVVPGERLNGSAAPPPPAVPQRGYPSRFPDQAARVNNPFAPPEGAQNSPFAPPHAAGPAPAEAEPTTGAPDEAPEQFGRYGQQDVQNPHDQQHAVFGQQAPADLSELDDLHDVDDRDDLRDDRDAGAEAGAPGALSDLPLRVRGQSLRPEQREPLRSVNEPNGFRPSDSPLIPPPESIPAPSRPIMPGLPAGASAAPSPAPAQPMSGSLLLPAFFRGARAARSKPPAPSAREGGRPEQGPESPASRPQTPSNWSPPMRRVFPDRSPAGPPATPGALRPGAPAGPAAPPFNFPGPMGPATPGARSDRAARVASAAATMTRVTTTPSRSPVILRSTARARRPAAHVRPRRCANHRGCSASGATPATSPRRTGRSAGSAGCRSRRRHRSWSPARRSASWSSTTVTGWRWTVRWCSAATPSR